MLYKNARWEPHTHMQKKKKKDKQKERKKNYLYILDIWTQNNLLLMQSACYIMRGLSLSQCSFTPCRASPPTVPHTYTRTHTLHLALTVIHPPTPALSPTSSVSLSKQAEREGKTARKIKSGWQRCGAESERAREGKLEKQGSTFMQRRRICMIR